MVLVLVLAPSVETLVLLFVVVSASLVAPALTTVVLFSFFSGAPAGVAVVSVFCSHAPRSAAVVRINRSFFISDNFDAGCSVLLYSRSLCRVAGSTPAIHARSIPLGRIEPGTYLGDGGSNLLRIVSDARVTASIARSRGPLVSL